MTFQWSYIKMGCNMKTRRSVKKDSTKKSTVVKVKPKKTLAQKRRVYQSRTK